MRSNLAGVVGAVIFGMAAPVGAQAPAPAADPVAQTAAPAPKPEPTDAEQKQSRYQIGVMERVLEGAVEHGASMTRDRLQKVVPAAMLLTDNARVRGFRLDGYGVFFDVVVPDMQGPLLWSFRTLDKNDLGLQSALKAIKNHIDSVGDQNLEQALKRVELQLGPLPATTPAVSTGARNETGAPAMAAESAGAPPDGVLDNPDETYRSDIRQALMDAMLDYSGPLAVGAEEWLTVAARRSQDRSPLPLAASDSDAHTMTIRIRGGDLAAFRAARITREEALKRIEVRVF